MHFALLEYEQLLQFQAFSLLLEFERLVGCDQLEFSRPMNEQSRSDEIRGAGLEWASPFLP
jgi:hypothetical protein